MLVSSFGTLQSLLLNEPPVPIEALFDNVSGTTVIEFDKEIVLGTEDGSNFQWFFGNVEYDAVGAGVINERFLRLNNSTVGVQVHDNTIEYTGDPGGIVDLEGLSVVPFLIPLLPSIPVTILATYTIGTFIVSITFSGNISLGTAGPGDFTAEWITNLLDVTGVFPLSPAIMNLSAPPIGAPTGFSRIIYNGTAGGMVDDLGRDIAAFEIELVAP